MTVGSAGAGVVRGMAPLAALVLVATALVVGCSGTENDTKAAPYGLPDLRQSLMAHGWRLDPEASSVAPAVDAGIT